MRRVHGGWSGVILTTTLVMLLAAMSAGMHLSSAAAHQEAIANVSVVDFAFEPGSLTVEAGTTVVWTNDGERPHTVTASDGAFDSGRLDPGESFSYRFEAAGTFPYACGFHPEMLGEIIVTEAPANADIEVATEASEQPAEAETTPVTGEAAGTAGPASDGRNLVPVEQSRLAHVHAGTCDELGIVVYSLPDIRTYRVDEGGGEGVGAIELISGTANVPLEGLFGEPFSIHVHESAQNKQSYLACADIGGRPASPWTEAEGLTLEAREQNDSGFSGFATLQATPAGGTSLAIAIAASPDAVEAVESQEAVVPSETYISPTFGYAIGYGPTWSEAENISANGRDRLVLSNDTSFVTFTSESAFNGDPQTCVDAFVDQLTSDPNVSNLALAIDENGEPLEGGTEATGAFAIYIHDYTFPNRVEPYTLFVGCVPLVENEAVLAIVQNVPTADYIEQFALRDALLRGLVLAQ